ncbi:hypothetical protein [Streptomyces collinus]|uniref:hypothetical protein n=1 Tax=Streptomyces collinus TaxID=42684 RepID=UPI0037FAFC94
MSRLRTSSRPMIIVPNGLSDVSRPEELLWPLFEHRLSRSHLRVDLRDFGIPLARTWWSAS